MEIEKQNYPLSIDFNELKEQKKHLLNLMMLPSVNVEQTNALEGIISMIDTIQDYAVDNLGYKEEEIFDINKND